MSHNCRTSKRVAIAEINPQTQGVMSWWLTIPPRMSETSANRRWLSNREWVAAAGMNQCQTAGNIFSGSWWNGGGELLAWRREQLLRTSGQAGTGTVMGTRRVMLHEWACSELWTAAPARHAKSGPHGIIRSKWWACHWSGSSAIPACRANVNLSRSESIWTNCLVRVEIRVQTVLMLFGVIKLICRDMRLMDEYMNIYVSRVVNSSAIID